MPDAPALSPRLACDAHSPRLAAFIANARLADIDDAAISAARIFLADTFAVGIAGTCNPSADGVFAAMHSASGAGDVSCLGRPGSGLNAYQAAVVNGFQIHCLEWDGLHEPSVVIALCATVGALTSELQGHDVSFGELVLAFVVGVETAVFFGSAAATAPRFFRPSAAGVMGAAAAIGKLRGFDQDQMLNLMGLAYCQAGGTMQAHWEGSEALALQVGFAARAALTAADLVRAGITGPHDVISGKFGYFALFETPGDLDAVLSTWGAPWKIIAVAHKPYPAGRATQAALTALVAMREEHDFAADDVASLQADVPSLIGTLVGRPYAPDMSPSYARLCLQYVVPRMLLDRAVDPRKFTAADFGDPQIAALAQRIVLRMDDNPDPNALGPQSITVVLKDGKQLRRDIAAPLGCPDNPLTRGQQVDKIARCFAAAQLHADPAAFLNTFETIGLAMPARAILAQLEGQ